MSGMRSRVIGKPQWTHRRRVRKGDTRAEIQVVDGRVETVERDLSRVEKDRAAERSPNLTPQLDGRLDSRETADRVVVAVSRSELAPPVTANALLASLVASRPCASSRRAGGQCCSAGSSEQVLPGPPGA
jgi:hypothetical protein